MSLIVQVCLWGLSMQPPLHVKWQIRNITRLHYHRNRVSNLLSQCSVTANRIFLLKKGRVGQLAIYLTVIWSASVYSFAHILCEECLLYWDEVVCDFGLKPTDRFVIVIKPVKVHTSDAAPQDPILGTCVLVAITRNVRLTRGSFTSLRTGREWYQKSFVGGFITNRLPLASGILIGFKSRRVFVFPLESLCLKTKSLSWPNDTDAIGAHLSKSTSSSLCSPMYSPPLSYLFTSTKLNFHLSSNAASTFLFTFSIHGSHGFAWIVFPENVYVVPGSP